ncbi:hypothetical protein PG996_002423 [Apiospora saccharicola]|uniref:DRBM domain-containing protein n=1 Tax=Apiospora saccharicola TaxID=335842 RepID=A0ABR1WJI1_9PEZI
MSSSLSANIYSDILQWVNMQQQLEISGQVSTMTAAQRKAVKDLHQLIKPRGPITEPELGRQDWIGLLNPPQGYRQAKPESHGVQFTDEPVEDPPAPLRWHCYCLIGEHREPFPCAARGLDPDSGLPPSFARKQSAKHYAARCAVEWLVQQGLMPQKLAVEVPGAADLRMGRVSSSATTTRPLPVSSSPSSPEAKRQKMTTSDPEESSSSTSSTSSTSIMKTEAESDRPTSSNEDDDDTNMMGGSSIGNQQPRPSLIETPAVAKIPQTHPSQPQPPLINLFTTSSSSTDSSASNSSGGTPIVPPSEPRTSPPASTIANININATSPENNNNNNAGEKKATAQITPDPENPNYFSAQPIFLSLLEAGHFPHSTGHVANVFGKANAKEEVAKRVLAELRKIKQQRDDVKRDVLGSLGPTVG